MSNIYWEEHKIGKNETKQESFEKFSLVSSSITTAEQVGGYDITGNNGKENSIMLMMTRKPGLFHRICTRFFLGWNWVDIKKEKKEKKLLLG